MAHPLAFCFPLLIPLADSPCSLSQSPLLTWKPSLLWQDLVHLGLRLLVNWPPHLQPLPIPSPLQIPSTQVNYAPHYDDLKNPASLVRNNKHNWRLNTFLYFIHLFYTQLHMIGSKYMICWNLTWRSVGLVVTRGDTAEGHLWAIWWSTKFT
jgi:hypothetical protein